MIKKSISYFKEVTEEMRKVSWPNRATTVRYSILVIVISALVAIFFFVLDIIFNLGLEELLQIAG